ncbi:MAG: Uma2 family endonuclease [Pirellulaceae bacterium]
MASALSISSPSYTLDDLLLVEGKAELVGGRIIKSMPSGYLPSQVAFEIAILLRAYAAALGRGIAFADGVGYAIRPPLTSGRQSFSPDASYYVGPPPPDGMKFVEGPPVLAVEVRSEGDYSPSAQIEIADKRADYFEAGSAVVWDVDPLARTITVYLATSPDQPQVFTSGQIADAEPALSGLRVKVSDVFK